MEEIFFWSFYICSFGHHFVHWSGTFCAIFVGNFPTNNPIKFGWKPPSGYGDVILNFSIFCSGLHFVQWSRMIWANLVEDLPRNNLSFVETRQYFEMLFDFFFFFFFSIFSSGCLFVQWTGTVWAILVEDPSSGYRWHLKFFFLELWQPFCAVEQKDLSNFGRGPPKGQSYHVWLKSAQ